MKLALIKNGVVENVAEGDNMFALAMTDRGYIVVPGNHHDCSPGSTWDGVRFAPPPPPPPSELDALRARLDALEKR